MLHELLYIFYPGGNVIRSAGYYTSGKVRQRAQQSECNDG